MAYFDRFDICAAYNIYSMFWGGDGCAYENGIQCRLADLRYRPSCSEEKLKGLSENAKEIYGALERRHHANHVAYERLHRRHPSVFPSWPGTRNVQGGYRGYVRSLGVDARALDCWSGDEVAKKV